MSVKPDRLAIALNGPRYYPALAPAFDSRLTFRRLRRPTTLPNVDDGLLARCRQWLTGQR